MEEEIKDLEDCIARIEGLKLLEPTSTEFQTWRYEILHHIEEIFGINSREYKKFIVINFFPGLFDTGTLSKKTYLTGLIKSEFILNSIIKKLKKKSSITHEDDIISTELIKQLPRPLQSIVKEINGCFGNGYYGAGSVMCRKAIEASIHIRFAKESKEDNLKDNSGEFFRLPKKIELAKQEHFINFQHANELARIRWFGDAGAHSYKINIYTNDLKNNISIVRLALEEIFNAGD